MYRYLLQGLSRCFSQTIPNTLPIAADKVYPIYLYFLTLKESMSNTESKVHLFRIKRNFFDEILSGRKKKEYRDPSKSNINAMARIEKDLSEGKRVLLKFVNGYLGTSPWLIVECTGVDCVDIESLEDPIVYELGEIIDKGNLSATDSKAYLNDPLTLPLELPRTQIEQVINGSRSKIQKDSNDEEQGELQAVQEFLENKQKVYLKLMEDKPSGEISLSCTVECVDAETLDVGGGYIESVKEDLANGSGSVVSYSLGNIFDHNLDQQTSSFDCKKIQAEGSLTEIDSPEINLTGAHVKYFAHELTKRSPSDDLQKFTSTLVSAQVDLNPHQIDAALFAFRSPLSKGAILADEVGLGKTIEAGILLSQKWAERKRKILIIAPATLRKQWSQELQEKFFLPSFIIEGNSFKQEAKNKPNPFKRTDEIVICSYQFAAAKQSYISQISWDLVVIDEAHKLRNVYKSSNKTANSIKKALNGVRHKILLTATPLQNTLLELYGLVSFIDPHVFGDEKSFKSQFSRTDETNFTELKARLKPLCQRTLRRQVREYVKYTNRMAILQEFYPSQEEEELYESVSEYLQRKKIYALPPSQRHLMTLILRKLLASSTRAIASTLERLIVKLQDLTKSSQSMESEEDILEKEISEDFEGFSELKDEWLEAKENKEKTEEDEDNDLEQEEPLTEQEIIEIEEEINLLMSFHSKAKSVSEDAKGKVLLMALEKGFSAIQERGAKKKALIFTESTRTQQYIKEILENSQYKDKIVLFNGSNNDKESNRIYEEWKQKYKGTDKISGSKDVDKRAALVEYFRDHAEIMIATEAAAEGVNLQFCSLIVNYDLPWNPQRIEQRIGRCHRYGQKYDVVVVNFLNKKNAADQRVYKLLSEKFQLFDGVFGSSDEVLGIIESGIDFEKTIHEICNKCRSEEQIQFEFDSLQKEMEKQIDEEMNNTKRKLLENFDEEVHEKLKINLEKSKEYLNTYERWLWLITKFYLKDYAEFNTEEKSFILRDNPFVEKEEPFERYKLGKNAESAHCYRIAHPLAQKLIESSKSQNYEKNELTFDYSSNPKKISIMESMVGKAGWLKAINFTLESPAEAEDHVILVGVTDDGAILDEDQCTRLFSLSASEKKIADIEPSDNLSQILHKLSETKAEEITKRRSSRSSSFLDEESEKLDRWEKDMEQEAKKKEEEYEDEIKSLKKQSYSDLEENFEIKKKIADLKKKKDQAYAEYRKEKEVIEERKDALLQEVKGSLKSKRKEDLIFTIKWRVI